MTWAAVTARGTLTRWVFVGGSCLVGLLLVAGFMIAETATALSRAQEGQVRLVEDARNDAVSLLLSYVDQESGLRGYVISGRDDFLQPYAEASRRIPGLAASLDQHVTALGLDRSPLIRLDAAYDAWSDYAQRQIAMVGEGRQAEASRDVLSGSGKVRFDEIRITYGELEQALDNAADLAHERTQELERRLLWLVVLAVVGLAVVVVGGVGLLVAAVAWPVAKLADGTRAVARGHLAAPLPAGGAREIRSLAADVGAMRDRLTVDLDVAKNALEVAQQQSPAVTALRQALLPGGEDVEGVTVAGRLDSAEGMLAGDWYDVINTGKATIAIVVGDVSGHGPGSAVLALRFRHAVAAALRAGLSPGAALTVLGSDLGQVPDDMFATMLVISVDTERGMLTYANAGHPSGLLLGRTDGEGTRAVPRGATAPDRLYWRDLPVTGPLLSPIVAGWAWGERHLGFHPGDTMLAFTDGLTEARDPKGEEFGMRRIIDVVAEVGVDDGPRLLDAICAGAVRHANFRSRQDDQTIVYVRRRVAGAVPASAAR